MKKYTNEEELKKVLGIETFRNLSKDKVVEFMTLLPNMDKEVALSAINQFPAYSELAGIMINKMKDMCETALKENSTSQKGVLEGYLIVLNSFDDQLKNNELTEIERESLNQKMIEIADKMSVKDTENKLFIKDIVKYGGATLGIILTLGSAILGISVKNKVK